MMSRRTLSIFAVVFGLLALVAVFQPSNGFRRLQDPELMVLDNAGYLFGDFFEGDIAALRINAPITGESLLIARTENGWEAPDLGQRFDAADITPILTTLVILPYWDTVPIADDSALPQFGFSDRNLDMLSVEILLVDGRTHGMLMGGLAPTADGIYTLIDDRPFLYLIEPRAVEFLRIQLMNPPFA